MKLYNNWPNSEKTGRLSKGFLYLILFPAGVLCLALLYFMASLSPVASRENAREVVVTVPTQASAGQVAKILKESGLVRSPHVFRLYARWRGLDGRLKAGEYSLSNGLSTPEVLRELVEGKLAVQSFTVPEGFTTAQVADLLAAKGLVDRGEFLRAVASEKFSYPFLRGLPEGERRLEGYLFPDTYQVTRGSSESSIIDLMLRRFEKESRDMDYQAQVDKAGLTLHQAVTIASMVEREARVDEERPVIAGVIRNRLERSIPLQIDATVQYALGANKPKIYYKDLEVDSPYNTYKVNGLPPGPIAMPGRASLLAAVNPVRTGYLYYVAKPDGTHAFATNLADHNANKERYQN